MRIAVTSDLHYDPHGHLTAPDAVRDLAAQIAETRPDLVVLAGDLGHGIASFGACVERFTERGLAVAVLAGNHDVWRDDDARVGSEALWTERLRTVTRALGACWLEDHSLRFGDVAVVGSMAWYDYSGVDRSVGATPEQCAVAKRMFNNDAVWLDWPWSDQALASHLADGLVARLASAAAESTVRAVVVATHVPIVEEQMVRRPDDARWGFSNAYFGHLTLGARVVCEPKVRAIVSGHTHCAVRATLVRDAARGGPIDVRVIGSEYGEPAFELVEV